MFIIWDGKYPEERKPTNEQVLEFVNTPLWVEFCQHIQNEYNVKPHFTFSNCNMDCGAWKGWNIKYKKSGKTICTLYPRQGYFVVSIVLPEKAIFEADLIIQSFSEYTQEVYRETKLHMDGKWVMLDVKDDDILEDAKRLVELRMKNLKR